ncbi:MAG: phosphoenolpyruvate hydrolase family protein [Sphingomonadaceae bacterium]|nr:phosphoenolpyruvate hydrolase family protein [Sphingomonadaceae bacterium]
MHDVVRDLARAAKQTHSPVLAVSAGSGQIAQYAVEAGADVLLALNAGLYRSLGHGSLASLLAYGNANEQTGELLRRHILPSAGGLPVIAGVMATDPTIDLDARLLQLQQMGVHGVTNWPTVGFIGGRIREAFEDDGLGLVNEVDLLAPARKLGMATFAFVLNVDDMRRFAEVGIDAYIINAGLTPLHFEIGNRQDKLQESLAHINRMVAAVDGPSRPLCLSYGGPFTDVEDFRTMFRQAKVDGIAGGSIFERLPVQAITSNFVRRCKTLRLLDTELPEPARREMLGASNGYRNLVSTIERVAPFDVSVVIEGETGVGKELAAGLIHELSPRSKQPLITLNCGAIPAGLLESELFGHERGAFTGADRRRIGKFELANRGTLLLDEIADLSPAAQVALLRVLQQREVVRVGADRPIPVNVRVIAATNRSLAELVQEGKFRSDLYYRLNTVTLSIPPLRERLDDLPVLVSAFLLKTAAELGMPGLSVDEQFERELARHSWPGNIRELSQAISRAAILEGGAVLRGAHFQADGARRVVPAGAAQSRRVTAHDIHRAIEQAGGNKSLAAAALRISRKTLYAKLESAGLIGSVSP